MSEDLRHHRLHIYKGDAYLIRDVRRDGKFLGCEYATPKEGLSEHQVDVEWVPCVEGVQFSDIKPLVRAVGEANATWRY